MCIYTYLHILKWETFNINTQIHRRTDIHTYIGYIYTYIHGLIYVYFIIVANIRKYDITCWL